MTFSIQENVIYTGRVRFAEIPEIDWTLGMGDYVKVQSRKIPLPRRTGQPAIQ